MKFEIRQYVVGQIATNCYFLCNMDSKELIVVDPGEQGELLNQKIRESGCTPVAILFTHGHFDHVSGAEEIRQEFKIPIYAHEAERKFLEENDMAMARQFGITGRVLADEYIHGEPVLSMAGFEIKVLETPGHTPGGCCYYLEEQKILLSGDTLFCGSVGRTDFPGGSMSALIRSVEDKLFKLPDDVRVLPGHENATSIGFEKKYNPYF